MSNRAAVPKRAHAARQPRPRSLHWQHEARSAWPQPLAHQRVERAQLRVARHAADSLTQPQQAHLPRRRLRVADARLRRAHDDGTRALHRAVHRRERARLRRIAQRRPSAVGLDASDLQGSQHGAAEYSKQ